MDVAFMASRYGKGEADYINCPMDEAQYDAFYNALMSAERTLHADYDPAELFEGCSEGRRHNRLIRLTSWLKKCETPRKIALESVRESPSSP